MKTANCLRTTMNSQAPSKEFTKACKEAEFFETDEWAARGIFKAELMTPKIIDPCAGRGVLGSAARQAGYSDLLEVDLNHWPGAACTIKPGINWLTDKELHRDIRQNWTDATVLMNPPFSKACEFVEMAQKLGARKIVMFQRLSFLESSVRRPFFRDNPPARVWLCGDRALCWRGDVPAEDILNEKGEVEVKGKKGRSTPTAHAWFVWERAHRGVMTISHIYKD